MTEISINVIGIMIGSEYKDFELFKMEKSWYKNTQNDAYTEGGVSGIRRVEGAGNIFRYLSLPLPANTQFVVVYDVSCPNKEDHIKKLLTGINKIKNNDLLPTLISIGHEQSAWDEEIMEQFSSISEVESTDSHHDLLKKIIEIKFNNTKKELLAADKADQFNKNTEIKCSQSEETTNSSTMNINMVVLRGFIAVAGITAVALAFSVLNSTTFGVAALVLVGIGVAASLSGVGLFACRTYKNKSTSSDISLDHSDNLTPI